MGHPHIDLTYLEHFCKGDRSRMGRYIRAYLEASPAIIAQLTDPSFSGDGRAMAMIAHSLRPQVTYMGAQPILDLLTSIEQRAQAEGPEACKDLLGGLAPLCEQVNMELRAALVEL